MERRRQGPRIGQTRAARPSQRKGSHAMPDLVTLKIDPLEACKRVQLSFGEPIRDWEITAGHAREIARALAAAADQADPDGTSPAPGDDSEPRSETT